ncbi:MAG TPA: malate synthase, partial [Thermoanaerobaculia bacterium]
MPGVVVRNRLIEAYPDVYTPEVLAAIEALAPLDQARREVRDARMKRRMDRARSRLRIEFLDPESAIPRTTIRVRDAREGNFEGPEIPPDLQRQWIQGTGPATKPRSSTESGLRNVAYALLSGADGWMFDGEDALGQVDTMSLDNQRNLKLAIAEDHRFLKVAESVAREMNDWGRGFFGREIIADWRKQLAFTTKIFRARGLHL